MGVSLLKYISTCPVTETASDCKGLSRRKLWKLMYCCDRSGVISSQDQLVPLFVEQMLGGVPGLSGLLVAGVFSASLSSISANLHSLATVSMQDFIRVWIVYISSQREIYKDLTDKTKQLNVTSFYFTREIFFSCPLFFVIHKTDFKHFEISNIALLNLDRLLCKFELNRVFKLHCCTILIHSKISLLLW